MPAQSAAGSPVPPADVPRVHRAVLQWYALSARDLPWRAPGTSPWQILVSEVMLQQTPVSRVLPAWTRWCERWPTPEALAAEPVGEAIRAWDRLGYPRRALRLHAAAVHIVERHGGSLPTDLSALRSLPGVGAYTAAAVASFAFRQRHAVLDTNVRRVLARSVHGVAAPPPTLTRAETALAESLLPDEAEVAARWAVAVMELGALICTARDPRCDACPLAGRCAWRSDGSPPAQHARRAQPWAGTDRQARGALLAAVRALAPNPATSEDLDAAWPNDTAQRERALVGLVADRLLTPVPSGMTRSSAGTPRTGASSGSAGVAWGLPGVAARDVRHFPLGAAARHA